MMPADEVEQSRFRVWSLRMAGANVSKRGGKVMRAWRRINKKRETVSAVYNARATRREVMELSEERITRIGCRRLRESATTSEAGWGLTDEEENGQD
ncbi:hypothetical protein E4U09_003572 [Claviceps aff. purpurea]|uniref:Uncharacterized protein n=1 Tax=Claviceps aff. purpurea TaxID=1967640 RepID=A0A9P7QG37_9HYPO|nr:hypothetical protein E4U09_003572 [Claviceps aff. purpurea]